MRRRRDAVNVRSHRRGGRRRRLVLAPWIVISAASLLVLSMVSGAYAWLATSGCSGKPVEATILSSPTVARILDNLGRRWADTEPSVGERCASVKVVTKNSADVAQALGTDWDPRRDGPRPHAWVPDSTAWLKLASARDNAARLIPDRQPSLARTPTVIAMPMPMAKAIGWPDAKLSWKQLGTEFAGPKGKNAWSRLGHPEWDPFKVGMINPVTSTAGLHALTAIADSNDDGRITDSERETLQGLSRGMHLYADDPSKIVGDLTKRDTEGEEKVLPYLSAFPILEHELRAYNNTNPRVPLAAVYPTDGTSDADYPYLTLDAPWSDKAEKQASQQFLDFARGPEGRQAFLDSFFRDPNRKAGKNLTGKYGVQPTVKTLPRAVPVPDSVSVTVATWVASNRPTKVLFVMDTSESMAGQVRGTEDSRLSLVSEATSHAVDLLSDSAQVGLWTYGPQHTEVVAPGPLGDNGRRDALQSSLATVSSEPSEKSGLYDTAVAAYQKLNETYQPNATNLVVLISDGKDGGGGTSLEDAVSKLKGAHNPKKPARLITIGFGGTADMKSLHRLATATGGRSYQTQYETDINSLLITALFNA